MIRKIILLFVVFLFFISCASLEEKDIKKNEKIKKIAIIEFTIMPPEFIDQIITSDASLITIVSAIINVSKSSRVVRDQEKLYPEMIKMHEQMVGDFCHFASDYWDQRTSNKIIDTKKLYNSSLYRSLPEKGVKTYPLKLSQKYCSFPSISIPNKSYNFYDISKSYNVLKIGVPSIKDYDVSEFSGYNTNNSESLIDKEQEFSQNLIAISNALNVDNLAVINVSVATGVDTKPYQHLVIRLFLYDKKGTLIDQKIYVSEKKRGEPSDLNHYKELLGNFKNQFVKMIDIMCFRTW